MDNFNEQIDQLIEKLGKHLEESGYIIEQKTPNKYSRGGFRIYNSTNKKYPVVVTKMRNYIEFYLPEEPATHTIHFENVLGNFKHFEKKGEVEPEIGYRLELFGIYFNSTFYKEEEVESLFEEVSKRISQYFKAITGQ